MRGSRQRDGLDRRMDQWLETGRQLVDGVSGRRPGQRRSSLDLDSVGRWVGEKVEWLLEDDDDWREPWQEQPQAPMPAPPAVNERPIRRPLDAISRRGQPSQVLREPPSGAQDGDAVYVSGTIGDGLLGLQAFGTATGGGGVSAYEAPVPQLALGQALAGVASACIDVSDGLAADLDHICRASQIAMEVEAMAVPLSAAGAAYAQDPEQLGTLLTGGDDYQLAFTVKPENEPKLKDVGRITNVALTRIGAVSQSPKKYYAARFMDANGAEIVFENRGYTHL